jgi:RNA-splicing ligase RtcB
VQAVTAVHGAAQAQVVGPALGNIVVMVHCESQNMGHQMGTKF